MRSSPGSDPAQVALPLFLLLAFVWLVCLNCEFFGAGIVCYWVFVQNLVHRGPSVLL